jgi:hypothetical protein
LNKNFTKTTSGFFVTYKKGSRFLANATGFGYYWVQSIYDATLFNKDLREAFSSYYGKNVSCVDATIKTEIITKEFLV